MSLNIKTEKYIKRYGDNKLDNMRLHCLQHVPFEDMANIEVWAKNKGFPVSRTLLYEGEELPLLSSFDLLVVMGGPMGVHDEAQYPWLKTEKKFIRQSMATGKMVLGICLGAQLIAQVLGANVTKNPQKEIGWFTVRLTPKARNAPLFHGLPEEFMAFHWHGDTFDIPKGAVHIASSEACTDQAFVLGRIYGLQFHLESSPESIEKLIKNCGDELKEAQYIQSAETIRSGMKYLKETDMTLSLLLDNIEAEYEKNPADTA
jgi:GMP synthase-like glutamine amidotransferase